MKTRGSQVLERAKKRLTKNMRTFEMREFLLRPPQAHEGAGMGRYVKLFNLNADRQTIDKDRGEAHGA